MQRNRFNVSLKLRMSLTDGATESAERDGYPTPVTLCLCLKYPRLLLLLAKQTDISQRISLLDHRMVWRSRPGLNKCLILPG